MNARLARLALALYPLAYRRRYGTEMEALLEDSGASPAVVVDLLRGAARAHLRPEPGLAAAVDRDDRLRLGVSAVLLCWVLFAAAGLALYKTTEGSSFEGLDGAPGLLGTARLAIQVLAVVGSLAVLMGAAPLVLIALRQARSRPEVRRAVLLAGGCLVAFAAATAALVLLANADTHLAGAVATLILAAWVLVALAAGVGCAVAARRGLFAIAAPRRALVFAAGCAGLLATAMVGIALLTLSYLADLLAAAPDLAAARNGPLGLLDVRVSLLLVLGAMVAVATAAFLGAARAWRSAAIE